MRQPPVPFMLPRYPVMGGLALLAIGVTVAWANKVNIDPLVEDPRITRGEVWRLLTSVLPHLGPFHLIFNVYWLWTLGTLVEEVFGHARTLGLIVLLAVGSGAAEWAILDGGVGLSGVGYGLWAMCWALGRHDPRFAEATDRNTNLTFIGWFVLCVITTATGLMPVGNIAHGVGAALGAILGSAVALPRRRPVLVTALSVLLLVSLAAATVARPWVNLSPRRGEHEAWLAYDAQTRQQHEAAITWYRAALRMRQNPAWWYNLGIALHQASRHAEALEAYRHATELAPEAEDYGKAYRELQAYLEGLRAADPTTGPVV